MSSEVNFLDEWIPEQMSPGTLFVLENAGEAGVETNPYWAVLACPVCGALGLITKSQFTGMEAIICGSGCCSAEYHLKEHGIRFRRPN